MKKRQNPYSMTKSLTITVGILMMIILFSVITLVERSITHHFELQDQAQLMSLATTIANNQHRMQKKMTANVLNQSLNMHQPIFAYTASFIFNTDNAGSDVPISDLIISPYINEIIDVDRQEIESKINRYLNSVTQQQIIQALTVEPLSQHTDFNAISALSHDNHIADENSVFNWVTPRSSYRVIIMLSPNNSYHSTTTNLGHLTTHSQDHSMKAIIVGLDTQFHEHYLSELRMQLLVLSIIAALVVMIFAYLLVRRGHKPITHISLILDHIATGKLKTRITETEYPIELNALIVSFNQMMDKLDHLFEQQASFSADIAHELRTPMTNLLTQTQIILQRQRTQQAYEEVLYANLEEFERLSKMINDMLFLAQADNQKYLPNMVEFNFLTLVQDVLDYFDALREDNHVTFQVAVLFEGKRVSPAEIETNSNFNLVGNESMMKRALSNLISNAISYATPHSQIEFNLSHHDNTVKLSIKNKIDTPISLENLDRLFDRFYRLDPAREKSLLRGGFGIGLSITQAIVHAHQGEIHASTEQNEFCMTLTLPK